MIRLTGFTRALYRKARDTHIAALLSAATAKSRIADTLMVAAEDAQERADTARHRAFKAKDHADLCWDATDAELDLIDVAA